MYVHVRHVFAHKTNFVKNSEVQQLEDRGKKITVKMVTFMLKYETCCSSLALNAAAISFCW
jgi:hypothetical protein